MKKILVPVDFSEVSNYAADFAVDLAEKSGAEIIFMHSMHFNYFNDFPHAPGVNLQTIIGEVKTSMDARINDFIEKLDTTAKVEGRISGVHLLEAVKDTVKEENIGLVIMGTKGSSGWSEFFAGSHTERIVRWTDCPVISVPAPTSFDSIKKVLIPIDLNELQDEFLSKLSKLQRLFSAEVEFLWVRTPHNIENNEQVREEFNKVISKYGFKNPSLTIANRVFPSDGILEQASDLGADMVAMATHARRGISHWLSGSLTEDTINHVKIPVWTFKLDKNAERIELDCVASAKGKAEYKKMELLAI